MSETLVQRIKGVLELNWSMSVRRSGPLAARRTMTRSSIIGLVLARSEHARLAGLLENPRAQGDFRVINGIADMGWAKESFGNWFRGACQAAGVPGSAHGLRKAGATRAAEHSSKPFTAGQGERWRRYTRDKRIAPSWREKPWGKLGTGKT
jgi:hypothetical protein